MKKTISAVLAVITVACCFSFLCAADGIGEIKNFNVDEYGKITWDDYGGYDNYWLQVDIYSTPVDHGSNLEKRIDEPGEYQLCLFLCDEDGHTVAQSKMYIKYDGDKFYKIEKLSETQPDTETEPKPEVTVDYGDGVIKDVEFDADGTLTWEPYDKAEDYWIGVNGNYTPAENGMNVKEKISEPGIYSLELQAYAEEGERFIAAWNEKIIYDGTVFKLRSEQEHTVEEQTEKTEEETTAESTQQINEEITDAETEPETAETVTETEDAQTKTETEAKSDDQKNPGSNSTKWIIAGVCIIVAAGAVAAVLIVRKKSEGK